MSSEKEDPEWMRCAQNGNVDAFRKLWMRHHRIIETHCIYICVYKLNLSREDAEDAALRTFLQAWVKRRQYHYPEAPKDWLFAISKNECLQIKRKRVNQGQEVPWETVKEAPATGDYDDPAAVVPNNPWPEFVTEMKKVLTAEEMVILFRTFGEGWTSKEVARDLEKNESTMRSTVAKIKSKARKVMETLGYYTQEEAR